MNQFIRMALVSAITTLVLLKFDPVKDALDL